MYPVVPSNHIQRAKVFVRRGTAYANISNYDLGMLSLHDKCSYYYEMCTHIVNADEYLVIVYGKMYMGFLLSRQNTCFISYHIGINLRQS